MVIAVVTVLVMQVVFDEIVHMIAVRNLFVAAGRTVLVRTVVRTASVSGIAGRWVLSTDGNIVLFNSSADLMVQMPVM